jgi:sRNA-binding regulator protein Hfq
MGRVKERELGEGGKNYYIILISRITTKLIYKHLIKNYGYWLEANLIKRIINQPT